MIVVFVLDTCIHLTQLHFVGKRCRKSPAKQTDNCDFFSGFQHEISLSGYFLLLQRCRQLRERFSEVILFLYFSITECQIEF